MRNAECGVKNDIPHSVLRTPNLLWEGRPKFSLTTSIQLTPRFLVIRRPKWRGNVWIPLDRILKVQVIQNRLDRWMGTGILTFSFRGNLSMSLKQIPEPFELWKRLKIARHHLTEPL